MKDIHSVPFISYALPNHYNDPLDRKQRGLALSVALISVLLAKNLPESHFCGMILPTHAGAKEPSENRSI